MKVIDETRLTEEDIRLAHAMFEGSESTDSLGRRFNLSGRQVHNIRCGKHRPQVFRYLEELRRDLLAADRYQLLHARKKALDVLVAGLKSPNWNHRIRCAIAIRRETVELVGAFGDEDGPAVVIDAAQAAFILKSVCQREIPAVGGNGHETRTRPSGDVNVGKRLA